MIRVPFDPTKLDGDDRVWWDTWEAKAREATRQIVERWEATGKVSSDKDFDPAIWGELKMWLLKKKFHGKCAYCETRMDRQTKAAEHFRPKAGVKFVADLHTKRKLQVPKVDVGGGQMENHPGYFWLAYDWRNLVPSCDLCNSGAGKNNQFPVAKRHAFALPVPSQGAPKSAVPSKRVKDGYFPASEELDVLEEPLLLHPYFDDPSEHIVFGEHGIEAAAVDKEGKPSAKGTHSIEVYDLKNDALRRKRAEEQRNMAAKFWVALANEQSLGTPLQAAVEAAKAHVVRIAESGDPRPPHLAATRDWIAILSAKLAR